MIFPKDVEAKLGFDQLRQRLRNNCVSGLGQREVDNLSFSADFHIVQQQLFQTAEYKKLLETAAPFPTLNFFDAEALLKTAGIEDSFLEGEDLLNIGFSLLTVLECKEFLAKAKEDYPTLSALGEPMVLSKKVPSALFAKLEEPGRVKDHASPDLSHVRKQLREEQAKVRKLMERIFRQAVSEGWVPEGVSATVRDGRTVIPILAEHKRKLRGFVMDESATGQTIYLEPAEVLEANNDIRDLEHAERREVVKILKDLTTVVRVNLPMVEEAYRFMGQLELLRAKARLSIDLNAVLPVLSSEPDLNWLHARHPLLYLSSKGKREVVPLTIDLTSQQRMLLVSGPNAGGKSVCLKTVGLIQYMVQCGLLAPVHDKSTIGIFAQIFLDIGDQQSIENDLSTYSSHLRNMAFFINRSTSSTLILLDELGSGTDPNFGGGIAQAVLSALVDRKAWGVATTHYYNLKVYAEHHPGIRNGAMLFDLKKLEPQFKLEIGHPGSSFALEIARKTGLPQETIAAAEKIIGVELTGLDTLIKTVGDEKQSLSKKAIELRQKEEQLTADRTRYEKLFEELEGKKKEIINNAKSEASHLIKETHREIEKTIRHIRENKAERKETRKAREQLTAHSEKVIPAIVKPIPRGENIQVGDKVRMVGQDVTGTVISIQGKKAEVQFGDLRSQIRLDDLIRSDQVSSSSSQSIRSFGLDINKKQSLFRDTLDVRGKRAEEIIPLLDQFLDDALLLGHNELKVLHGKGGGVLRQVVRERLKKNKQVVSVKDEHIERGGDGITVIVLK